MKLLRCSDSSQKMQRPHLLCASFPFKKTKTKHENGCRRHPKRLFWFDIKLCQFISQNLLQCAAHTASSNQKQKRFYYLSILSCQKQFHYFVKGMNKNLKCLKREKSAVKESFWSPILQKRKRPAHLLLKCCNLFDSTATKVLPTAAGYIWSYRSALGGLEQSRYHWQC